MARSAHAAFSYSQEYPDQTKKWINESGYIAVLHCENEKSLFNLIEIAKINNINISIFTEPDLDNQITAIALSACKESKRICRNLTRANFNWK